MVGHIGDAWVTIHADGSGLDREVASEFDDLDATFAKAGHDNTEAYNKARLDEHEKGLKELARLETNQNRGFRSQQTKTVKEIGKSIREARTELSGFKGEDAFKDLWEDVARLTHELKIGEQVLTHFEGRTKGSKKTFGEWSDSIGKLFGKGSRNDFVNVLGGVAGALGAVSIKAFEGADALGKMWKQSEGLGDFLTQLGSGAGKGITGLFAGVPEALPVIAGLTAALSALASIASLAIGAIVALAGTIAQALVGAIGLAAAALLPLVAGIGVTVAGFIALDDAQKQLLKTDLKPVTDNLKGLAQIAGQNIFGNMAVNARLLAPALSALAPLVDNLSAAVRRQIDAFAGLVAGGGLDQFFATLTQDAGGQIDALGAIFRNLLTSITGLFVGISPILTQFLNDLAGITAQFSRFVNSAKGSEAVTSFFQDAYNSVKALGSALLESVKFIGNLARVGAKFGGDDLFGKLADKFKEWSDWLTDPANQGAIQQWVSDGAAFASAVGNIIVQVGRFFAALDTPFFRTVIIQVFQAIGDAVEAVAFGIGLVTDSINAFINAISSVTGWVGGLVGKFLGLGDAQEKSKEKTDDQGAALTNTKKSLDDYTTSSTQAAAATKQQSDDAAKAAGQWFVFGQKVKESKVSLDDFLRTQAQQTKALQEFTSNLIAAGSKGVDQGLLKHLKDMGPQGAAALAELANASQREIGKANRQWAAQQRAIEGSTTALKNYNNTPVDPKTVNIHTSAADAALKDLQDQYDKLKDKTVTVTVATRLAAQSKRLQLNPQADGGILYGPTAILAGEAGPEAVVPLNRPLSQVDPSVRELSAFAQGKQPVSANARPVAQTVIESGAITVITPASDAKAVALETLNYVVAQGY